MKIQIGDRIIYRDEERDGVYFLGKIVDIWMNNRDKIIGYLAELNSGLYVHIQPNYILAE